MRSECCWSAMLPIGPSLATCVLSYCALQLDNTDQALTRRTLDRCRCSARKVEFHAEEDKVPISAASFQGRQNIRPLHTEHEWRAKGNYFPKQYRRFLKAIEVRTPTFIVAIHARKPACGVVCINSTQVMMLGIAESNKLDQHHFRHGHPEHASLLPEALVA